MGRNELLDEVGLRSVGTCGQQLGHPWMAEPRCDEALELTDQLIDLNGTQRQPEQLDGDLSIAFLLVRAKDGTERAGADLLKLAKTTNRIRRRWSGTFGVQ
jgi:hypothetical protein